MVKTPPRFPLAEGPQKPKLDDKSLPYAQDPDGPPGKVPGHHSGNESVLINVKHSHVHNGDVLAEKPKFWKASGQR